MKKKGKRLLAVILLVVMSLGVALGYLPGMLTANASDSNIIDDSFAIGYREDIGTKLDAAFNIYEFDGAINKISGEATRTGEPSSSDYATTGGHGTRNQGYLKLKGAGSDRSSFLTYMSPVTNFTAEYTFYTYDSQIAGIVFGGGLGTFPITFDNNNANDTGVMIFMSNESGKKVLNIAGAIDPTTTNYLGSNDYATQSFFNGAANIRGKQAITSKAYPNNLSAGGYVQSSESPMTLVVEVNNRLLTVYEKDTPNQKVTVELTDAYQGGYVSIGTNAGHYNTSFKAFSMKAPEYSFNLEYNKSIGTKLDGAFNIYEFEGEVKNISGAAVNSGEPSSSSLATTGASGTRNQGYLKMKGTGSGKSPFLTYMTEVTNFTAEYTFYTYNSQIGGLVFGGGAGTFPISFDNNNANDTGVIIYLEHSDSYGKILNIGGAIKPETTTGSGYTTQSFLGKSANIRCTSPITSKTYRGSAWVESTDPGITLVVTVNNGVLTVHEKDTPNTKVSVELTDAYEGGYVSLFHNANHYNNSFKAFSLKAIEKAPVEIPEVPAVEGDSFAVDFTETTNLDADFNSYYFASESVAGEKGEPSVHWTTANDLADYAAHYKNQFLKPVHKTDGTKQTLLTYQKKSFKNVDITAEYITNHLRYGVMIAPKGELSTTTNGVRVYVEGGGAINIQGAIDAASGTATGGYVYVNNRNHLKGYGSSLPGYVSALASNSNSKNNTAYKLHVRISGNTMSVWLEQFSDYVITVQLTDDYEGGMVSLYSTGYNHGGFKSFTASEMENVQVVKDDTIYTQSFNTITSLDALNDFEAYQLKDIEKQPTKATISDVFRLSGGALKSNATVSGSFNDDSNFGILTLKKQQYDNFELTLKYQQNSLRYGVMFGTKLGEFAYSANDGVLEDNGGVLVYTEMEGYRNVKGSVNPKAFRDASEAKKLLARKTENPKLESFTAFSADGVDDVVATLRQTPIHTMTIRVVDGSMTIIIDNNEASRMTVKLNDYEGGYISLVTSSNRNSDYGAFLSLSIKELGDDAELGTDSPEVATGYKNIRQVSNVFDAYYMENLKESNKYQSAKVSKRWFVNKDGFVTKVNAGSGITVNEGVDVLTYKEKEFEDFELTYTYQQSYQRLGVIIGGEKGEYPLAIVDDKLVADKGALVYVEAEGYPNAKGHLHNYTNQGDLLYRIYTNVPDGFTDGAGSPTDNVNARKVHTVKVVVKDKQMYVYLDNSSEPTLYVKLGDDYKGGYVSLFSSANSNVGFGSFEISDKVTTKLPKAGGTEKEGNIFTANFDSFKFDSSDFTTYYLDAVKGNEKGTMSKAEFDDQWTVANGVLKRTSKIANGSDVSRVSVLTYNKVMTDFVATYRYQQDSNRLMFMFGAEKGKYALHEGQGGAQRENGGVVLYPEYDLGAGGGVVALGEVYPSTADYRPSHRVTIEGLDYYNKENGSHSGNWHTMTVAVINKHCYIYIDEYGLVDDFDLSDDYRGGYLSIASSGNAYGFDDIQLKELTSISTNAVVDVEIPEHLEAKVGTKSSDLKLPATVKVTLKNGKKVSAAVDWKNLNYDGDTVGTYKFTGTIKESAEVKNPGQVGVEIGIRVLKTLTKKSANVKEWSFDTEDDLKDFTPTFIEDEKSGKVTKGAPQWYIYEKGGKLGRDEMRAPNGSEKSNIGMLTYKGEKYKNFELEVDYSWTSGRMMVLFGSQSIGQYIDLKKPKSETNPVAVFVEMEGVRNVIGNVRNTDYYKRTDTTIASARDNTMRISDYYNADDLASNKGVMHHMKIRVVEDQISVWIDNAKDPFVATITNYKGGYISLVNCAKGGKFDNLKITKLSDSLKKDTVETVKAVANGNCDLTIDANASTKLEIPEQTAPETFEAAQEIKNADFTKTVILGSAMILTSIVVGGVIILGAIKKRKKGALK